MQLFLKKANKLFEQQNSIGGLSPIVDGCQFYDANVRLRNLKFCVFWEFQRIVMFNNLWNGVFKIVLKLVKERVGAACMGYWQAWNANDFGLEQKI